VEGTSYFCFLQTSPIAADSTQGLATVMYREMDMRFCIEEAKADVEALA
jgi:hypothetical protein